MSQPGLFDRLPGPLVDGIHGRVDYWPEVIDVATARAWFEALHAAIHWQAQRRPMYGRDVDVPRLSAHWRLDDPAVPPLLVEAAGVVARHVNAPFNAVGLNLYRDGRDSVAPHNDHLDELERGQPIALLSLGAVRRMDIRAKAPPRRLLHVDLAPGSLLVMSHATQRHYDHGIPKLRDPVGPRISLAFRVRSGTGRRSRGFYERS